MINWARVTELRDEIGAEDFDDIVKIFLEEVDEEIGLLRGGIADDALESKLHFLKGSALNLGFAEFTELCETGEHAAASGAYDQIDVSAIIDCYEVSKTEFLGALESQFAA